MEHNELKPCPFCGGVAELHTGYHSINEIADKKSEIPKDAMFLFEKVTAKKQRMFYYKRKKFIPRCTVTPCVGRTTHIFWDEEVAINAWNRRANDGT